MTPLVTAVLLLNAILVVGGSRHNNSGNTRQQLCGFVSRKDNNRSRFIIGRRRRRRCRFVIAEPSFSVGNNNNSNNNSSGGLSAHLPFAFLQVGATNSWWAGRGSGDNEQQRQQKKTDYEYERRREAWDSRYGSVDALRSTFGSNRNKLWGDLDPESTRRLYHTLLPRSLLGLHEAGIMKPDELAPLAYKARVAAKEYARERSALPGRMLAITFDAYRSLRDYGQLRTKGMSWEQLWDKYEAQIVEEECSNELEALRNGGDKPCFCPDNKNNNNNDGGKEEGREELTTRIYLRILERSCATNKAFDEMFLQEENHNNNQSSNNNDSDNSDVSDWALITDRLERDVRDILLHPTEAQEAAKRARKAEKKAEKIAEKAAKEARKAEKREEKAKREEEKMLKKAEKKRKKARKKAILSLLRKKREVLGMVETKTENNNNNHSSSSSTTTTSDDNDDDNDNDNNNIDDKEEDDDKVRERQAWSVQLMLDKTRRKFRDM